MLKESTGTILTVKLPESNKVYTIQLEESSLDKFANELRTLYTKDNPFIDMAIFEFSNFKWFVVSHQQFHRMISHISTDLDIVLGKLFK